MVSPKATGGAGVHFESRAAAYYLSSLLVEGAVRGLGNAVAKEVRLQRRYEGQPLDDVIIKGTYRRGGNIPHRTLPLCCVYPIPL